MECLVNDMLQRESVAVSEDPQAYLIPYPAESFSRPVSLMIGKTLIGRDSTNHVQLAHSAISRNHAVIKSENGRYILTDLGSRNGTYVNKRRIKKVALNHHDKVSFGNRSFKFLLKSDPLTDTSTDLILTDSDSVTISENEFDPADLLAQMAETAALDVFKVPKLTEEDVQGPESLAHERLLLLYQLSDRLRSAVDMEEILDAGLELVLKAIPTAERSVIMLKSNTTGSLEVKALKYSHPKKTSEPIPVSRTILDWVLTERMALVSKNVLDDKRFKASDSIRIQGCQTMLCVPLMQGSKVVGVVYVDSGNIFNPMTQEDLSFAAAVANEMAVSMENIRLQNEALHNERMAAIGMTITNIAHNIKNLINVNFNAVDLMGMHLDKIEDKYIHRNWSLVRRGFERINNLSADMLDFAKEYSVRLQPTDINEAIMEHQDFFEQSLMHDGVEFDLRLTPKNPTWVMDKGQFQRAVLNLIVNAIDAVKHKGDGRVQISTNVEENKRLMIKVSDNGNGITPDHRDKIFNLFYTTKGTGGSGLGLPMVKKFVERMDGELIVKSQMDSGSSFKMIFPYKESS